MTSPVRATIDLDAARHNLRCLRARAAGAKVLAVVKGNAYGHGLAPVARALAAADGFAVARVDEALALRAAGIEHPVVVLSGFLSSEELEACAGSALEPVVHQEWQLEVLEARGEAGVRIWLKLDTGMNRLGFPCEAAAALWERLRGRGTVRQPPVWTTHLASADERRGPATARQVARFAAALEGLPGERSIANSAGLLGWPETRGDWVRPGIALYGISPFVGGRAEEHGLRPVMTLRARLVGVRPAGKGAAVGYGGGWVCPRDTTLGVVAIGYADGYPRHAPSGAPVRVGNAPACLVGRVSMDLITIDLGSARDARPGDWVTLWGEGLPAEAVAEHAGTIAYELVSRIGGRVALDVVGADG